MKRRELLLSALATPIVLGGRIPAARAARLGGTPLALITADLESHVVVFNIGAAQIEKRIPTPPGPRSIESWLQTLAVVAHTQHGLVSVVDVAGLRVRHVVEGFEQPRYTATGGLTVVYVTDSGREEVVTFDPTIGEVVRRTRVPGPARHLSLSPDGSTLWVSLGSKAERIAILDVRDAGRPRLKRTIVPPFRAHDVVFAPDGGKVWVTSGDQALLAIYSANGRGPLRLIRADAPPQHVFFLGHRAFVASGEDGTMRVYRRDGSLMQTAAVPKGSYNVTGSNGRVLTPSLTRGTVSILDWGGNGGQVREVAASAHDACVVTG